MTAQARHPTKETFMPFLCYCYAIGKRLVPSAVVKHDSLRNLPEKLQFWQQDLPTPSSLLSKLKERQYFWKQYTPTLQLRGNVIECVKYADEEMHPNIQDLPIIGCTFPVSSAEAERSFSG